MSQSWDNVANMHELLTACSVLNCQLVQCACTDESSTLLWCRPHPSLQENRLVLISLVYQTTPSPALDVLHHQRGGREVVVMQYIQSWEGSGLVHETKY